MCRLITKGGRGLVKWGNCWVKLQRPQKTHDLAFAPWQLMDWLVDKIVMFTKRGKLL